MIPLFPKDRVLSRTNGVERKSNEKYSSVRTTQYSPSYHSFPVAVSCFNVRVEDVPPISTNEIDTAIERYKTKKW